MKILTNLAPVITDGEPTGPRGYIQAIHDAPVSGFFRKVTLGPAGLTIHLADKPKVFIPLAEILRAAELADDSLIPPRLVNTPISTTPAPQDSGLRTLDSGLTPP